MVKVYGTSGICVEIYMTLQHIEMLWLISFYLVGLKEEPVYFFFFFFLNFT